MTQAKVNVYDIVTNRMIEELEKGVIPWRQPWSNKFGIFPTNYKSKKEYRGINILMLGFASTNPYWLTFKQVRELGGTVKKGSKSQMVFFFNWVMKDANGKTTKDESKCKNKFANLRYYRVFSADDIDGIEFEYPAIVELNENERIERCEELVKATGAVVKHGGDKAFFTPIRNFIKMPIINRFDNSEAYYSVLFHELTHWTGAPTRLARFARKAPSRKAYAKEELVAEMGANFLCFHTQITNEPLIQNSASYIANWIEALKGNPKLIIQAAAQAQKAFDFITE